MPIKMSRDEIRAVYLQGEHAVIALVELLIDNFNILEERVAKLESQRSKDSHNSSKPPSTDWFRKPKSLVEKTKRQPGGQPGHPGNSLRQVADPDRTKHHALHGRCSCGCNKKDGALLGHDKRQVFDVPPQNLEVTEHQAEIRRCKCGEIHTAEFPAGVDAPVQYGPRIRAILLYLSVYQLLPQKRISQAMADLFGVAVSEGTINTVIQRAYNRLEATEEAIRAALMIAWVVHGDETGMYIGGKRLWQHTLGTKLLTYYFVHANRGKIALRENGTLQTFFGRLVHDGWVSYFDIDCLHALCNAHHLRELIFIGEQGKQRWATTMVKLLCHIKKTVDRAKSAGRNHLAHQTLSKYQRRYEAIIANGYRANPITEPKIPGRRGRKKQSPARNLLDRLTKYSSETLAFMHDFNVPFDNNLSERDLRMSKVKQKVSGCFRSLLGAQAFCRIRGYISTVRKHGHNVFDDLVKCFDPSVTENVLLPLERE
jgi:transposase